MCWRSLGVESLGVKEEDANLNSVFVSDERDVISMSGRAKRTSAAISKYVEVESDVDMDEEEKKEFAEMERRGTLSAFGECCYLLIPSPIPVDLSSRVDTVWDRIDGMRPISDLRLIPLLQSPRRRRRPRNRRRKSSRWSLSRKSMKRMGNCRYSSQCPSISFPKFVHSSALLRSRN